MVHVGQCYEPDVALHARYMEKYQVFSQVYPALAEINHKL